MPTATITTDSLIQRYATNIAYVAEMTSPATDLTEFTRHLTYTADNLAMAGITGAEDLAAAVNLLLGTAAETDGSTRDTLLLRTAVLLKNVPEMTGEYRTMVGD